MPALYLRPHFHCREFFPYINPTKPQSDHLLAIEICFYVCAVLHVFIALRNKRFFTLLGIYIFGSCFEYIGFTHRSHMHNQFRVQVACFLPLKEVFWYGNTVFMGLIVAENAGLRSRFTRALLAGLVAIIQDIPYEMVSSRDMIDNYYVNEIDFPNADMGDKYNGASAPVVISFFLLACAGAYVAMLGKDLLNVVLVPVFGVALGLALHFPYHLTKYVGCRDFIRGEPTWEAFHVRCTKYSVVQDSALWGLFGVMAAFPVLLALKNQVFIKRLDALSTLAVFIVTFAVHGVIIYNVLQASDVTYQKAHSQIPIFVSFTFTQLALIWLSLDPLRSVFGSSTVPNKNKTE